jgi:hypothetical protein
MRWSANEARQRTQEKRENQISIREVTHAFGSMVRAAFNPIDAVRRNLALVSLVLSIIFIYWTVLTSVQYSVPGKNTGDASNVLLLLDACLYWSLALPIPTFIRRWIASGALGISIWIWISMILRSSSDFPDPVATRHITALIFFPMVGVFITLASISFIGDNEDVERRESL